MGGFGDFQYGSIGELCGPAKGDIAAARWQSAGRRLWLSEFYQDNESDRVSFFARRTARFHVRQWWARGCKLRNGDSKCDGLGIDLNENSGRWPNWFKRSCQRASTHGWDSRFEFWFN